MKTRWAALGLLLCVITGCLSAPPPAPTPAPSAPPALPTRPPAAQPTATAVPISTRPSRPPAGLTPAGMLALLEQTVPPDRDLHDLASRLRPTPGAGGRRLLPRPAEVGGREYFWVANQPARSYFSVAARLVHRSAHAQWYVQEGETVPVEAVQRSAQAFEERILPRIWQGFGLDRWLEPPEITVLTARVPGVVGYFSATDTYPRWVNPYSNERPMVYLNLAAAPPGTPAYEAGLAHEFFHLVQLFLDPTEETWVNEGAAEVAIRVAGYPNSSTFQHFLRRPDIALTGWAAGGADTLPHYGAAALFLEYFARRFGGYRALGEVLADPRNGPAAFDAYLQRHFPGWTFTQVFQDWVVANVLNDPGLEGGRYAHVEPGLRVTPEVIDQLPAWLPRSLPQFAAHYYVIQTGQPTDLQITFSGTPTVRVVGATPRSGRFVWWSNRGDGIASRLTRRFDLTGLSRATLRFAAWFDIERDYDYAFVEISTDGGQTWRTLPGRYTTAADPSGNNFGHGYTGRSGGALVPRWLEETIDLTPYAGRPVLLRFEYVTDDAYNGAGLCLDDIALPEIGFFDDAEQEAGWDAEGFVRLNNLLPQQFSVQIITLGPTVRVIPLPLDTQNRGQIVLRGLGRTLDRVLLVVAAVTPFSVERASYQVTVEAPPGGDPWGPGVRGPVPQ